MKMKHLLVVMITFFFLLYGCSNNGDSVEESAFASKSKNDGSNGSGIINRAYPQEEAEVLATFGAIGQSIVDNAGYGKGAMDQLISFHAYGPKFTEFNDGKVYDSGGNEINERTFFGEIVDKGGVKQFGAMDGSLKVAVYFGNVANVTFISDFILEIDEVETPFNNLITLLFVKTMGGWKMVHEHHSDVFKESGSVAKSSLSKKHGSRSSVIDQTYLDEQAEVLATFVAIGESIKAGAGYGKDGPYMDQLISFHAYGKKFTEFNDGKVYDSKGNEENERTFFGETVDKKGVKHFGAMDGSLKIAVYNGNVANLTFISDFHLEINGGNPITVNNLITLLFVKTKGEWKMVHEHHSKYNHS